MRCLALVMLAACWATHPGPPAPIHTKAVAGPIAFHHHTVPIAGGVRAVATDGKVVLVLTYDDVLLGITTGGHRLFRRELAMPSHAQAGLVSIVAGTAVISTYDVIYGLSASTGVERWRRVAAEMDMLTSQIHGDAVWIDGDGGSYTIEAATGRDVTRRVPATPARTVATTYIEPDRLRLAASRSGRTLWSIEYPRPILGSMTHYTYGDTTLFVRGTNAEHGLIAVDAETGRARFTFPIGDSHFTRYVYDAPGFYWVVLDDTEAMRAGDVAYRFVALDDDGKVIAQLDAPAARCSGDTYWASAGGVLAYTQRVARTRCEAESLEIFAP